MSGCCVPTAGCCMPNADCWGRLVANLVLAVLSAGGASLKSGQMEVMVHRRTLAGAVSPCTALHPAAHRAAVVVVV